MSVIASRKEGFALLEYRQYGGSITLEQVLEGLSTKGLVQSPLAMATVVTELINSRASCFKPGKA